MTSIETTSLNYELLIINYKYNSRLSGSYENKDVK